MAKKELTNTKEVITEVLGKLKKSIEREDTYLKELEDDKATLTYIEKLVEDSTPFPEDNPYNSFTEWSDSIKKEIKAGESSLKRIETEKAEIVAFEFYLANVDSI